jgi:KIF-1 binding protein C terminal
MLQEHSKLYHYLAAFETEVKRRLAMENRRVEILQPLLGSLSRTAFDVLHKQVSFELGEAYLALLDVKLDKFRGRAGGDVDEGSLKKAEIAKCNGYCKGAIAMFAHFTNMYAPTGKRQDADPSYSVLKFEDYTAQQLCARACIEPDEVSVTAEEVRPFLNAHFMTCRALTKLIAPPGSAPAQRSEGLVEALRRYSWLSKYGTALCERKGVDINDPAVFGEEIQICRDMTGLLPPKIDRMHYQGERGLSL